MTGAEATNTTAEGDTYFAYGTLLGQDAMREYCPTAVPIAVAAYAGHQLEFRQYSDDSSRTGCNLAVTPGEDMYGVVYQVVPDELANLDVASGVPQGWFRRIPIKVQTLSGETLNTTTYVLCEPGPALVPPPDYLGLVRTGARVAGLPTDYAAGLESYLDALVS